MNAPAQPGQKIGVISDTHGRLSARALEVFQGVGLILHAGDIGREDVLDELEALAPVRAVSGNIDGPPTSRRPLIQRLETPAGRIAMTHGHLTPSAHDRPNALIRQFLPFKPAIIVFGHTHRALLEVHENMILFNPGSATLPRAGARASVGLITAGPEGAPPRLEHVWLE